jgi:SAM-dependent methyltransferase
MARRSKSPTGTSKKSNVASRSKSADTRVATVEPAEIPQENHNIPKKEPKKDRVNKSSDQPIHKNPLNPLNRLNRLNPLNPLIYISPVIILIAALLIGYSYPDVDSIRRILFKLSLPCAKTTQWYNSTGHAVNFKPKWLAPLKGEILDLGDLSGENVDLYFQHLALIAEYNKENFTAVKFGCQCKESKSCSTCKTGACGKNSTIDVLTKQLNQAKDAIINYWQSISLTGTSFTTLNAHKQLKNSPAAKYLSLDAVKFSNLESILLPEDHYDLIWIEFGFSKIAALNDKVLMRKFISKLYVALKNGGRLVFVDHHQSIANNVLGVLSFGLLSPPNALSLLNQVIWSVKYNTQYTCAGTALVYGVAIKNGHAWF